MPKRVIDFDALWASDKIASCPAWAQAEYAWLYGLADASGSFELTNLRVIWGRVAAVRKDLSLERLAPPVPSRELAAYTARFSSRREASCDDAVAAEPARQQSFAVPGPSPSHETVHGDLSVLKAGLESAQAQDWDREWKKEEEREHTLACESSAPAFASAAPEKQNLSLMKGQLPARKDEPSGMKDESGEIPAEELLRIYERERGETLPAAAGLTPERRRFCAQRIRAGLTAEQFAAAVRRAAATPFLCGEGARGWRANFDWLIANDTNVRKVNEGAYEPAAAPSATAARVTGGRPLDRALYAEIHAGAGPVAAQCGARVRPEVLERIRAREAARGSP
jgi:hypothetical protein